MANSYQEMFEEEFYPPAFRSLAREVIGRFNAGQEKITSDIKGYLNQYMDDLYRLQEAGLAGTVSEITLSLLYTSLEEKSVEFRIDSYGEGGFLYEDTLLAERFPAPWLAENMSTLSQELEKHVVEENLRRYIRPAQIERLKLRALRSLLAYFSSRFRYVIADALDRKRLARLKKGETFVITMGEYLNWQKVIFALLPEVDIFNCEAGTSFRFRRFLAIYYEGKNFQDLNLCDARFTDSTFRDCTMDGCQLNDCIFDGCTFKNVVITGTEMIGCLFIGCDLKEVYFQEVSFFADETKQEQAYYEPTEFLDCAITDCRIEKSDLSRCGVKDCDIHNLCISQSAAEASGFGKDERVTWSDKGMEVE